MAVYGGFDLTTAPWSSGRLAGKHGTYVPSGVGVPSAVCIRLALRRVMWEGRRDRVRPERGGGGGMAMQADKRLPVSSRGRSLVEDKHRGEAGGEREGKRGGS